MPDRPLHMSAEEFVAEHENDRAELVDGYVRWKPGTLQYETMVIYDPDPQGVGAEEFLERHPDRVELREASLDLWVFRVCNTARSVRQ